MKHRNLAIRIAGCLWDMHGVCPECGNSKEQGHMESCSKEYDNYASPLDCEKVFKRAFESVKSEPCDCLSQRCIPGETGPEGSLHRFDCPNLKMRLFYYDEGVDAWCPLERKIEDVLGCSKFSHGEVHDLKFKFLAMTDEQFDSLPEL